MNNYKYLSHYGPGGRKCTCCGPSPKYRRTFDRMVKRREHEQVKRTIKKALENDE